MSPHDNPPTVYRQLLVWQKADRLAYEIYRTTKRFPAEERFGLADQMRRASVSVTANIVAGYTASPKREKRRFYDSAKSSFIELEYYIDFVHSRLRYVDRARFERLSLLQRDVGRLLNVLVHFVP